ncbi:helix-turn-helix transcriptional regulator [Paenibacillus cymbidii]|uniref:helix-turn-helix transcriptional regulator n=1 Tax=Paenibacillus cymbidii TaxID=1639034 RepID=UPI001436860B|nr:AraC family transcriptional regulator [Paenibacillus cymbidii]
MGQSMVHQMRHRTAIGDRDGESTTGGQGCTLVYLHAGECRFRFGSSEEGRLKAGDLLVGASGEPPALEDAADGGATCVLTVLRLAFSVVQPLLRLFGAARMLQLLSGPGAAVLRLTDRDAREAEELLARIASYRRLPEERLQTAVIDLLLFAGAAQTEEPVPAKRRYVEKEKIVHDVIAYLESQYMNEVTMDALAARIHLHPTRMMKLFKELTGMTIFHYLNQFRINQAKLLLYLNKELPVAEIGARVGFKQPSHFSRNFKEIVGLTPEQYRKLG